MFFLAEFISTLFMSALFSTIYLGGYNFLIWDWVSAWTGSGVQAPAFLEFIIFFVKMFAVYFVFIWIRATFPRVRIDQMLNFNWKFLVPVTLVLILGTALVDGLFIGGDQTAVWHAWRIAAHLGLNLLIGIGALAFAQKSANSRGLFMTDTKETFTAGALIEGADAHGHHDDHGHGHVAAPAHD
jgi:NADH-quinone oxidoreductase subunit H